MTRRRRRCSKPIDVYGRVQGPVIAVERVPREEVSAHGIIASDPAGDRVHRIRDLVEKPTAADAPSNLAIIGRYILTPDIFPELEATASDHTGEIQLTTGLRRLLAKRPLYACEIRGVRHDTGHKSAFCARSSTSRSGGRTWPAHSATTCACSISN